MAPRRYERKSAGELLHIDTKKLARFDAMLLEEYSLPQFSAAALVRTPNYQAVVCQSGGEMEPCLVRVAQLDATVAPSDPEMLRARSGAAHPATLVAANEYLARRRGVPMGMLEGGGVWAVSS